VQGLQGASGVVSLTTYDTNVSRSGIIPTGGAFVILGAPLTPSGQSITVTSTTQNIVGAITATGQLDASTILFGLCYQSGSGTVTLLGGSLSSKLVNTAVGYVSLAASGTGTLPAAGTYTVGWCASQGGTTSVTFEADVVGWVMVTN
jgi:hypothetical protein